MDLEGLEKIKKYTGVQNIRNLIDLATSTKGVQLYNSDSEFAGLIDRLAETKSLRQGDLSRAIELIKDCEFQKERDKRQKKQADLVSQVLAYSVLMAETQIDSDLEALQGKILRGRSLTDNEVQVLRADAKRLVKGGREYKDLHEVLQERLKDPQVVSVEHAGQLLQKLRYELHKRRREQEKSRFQKEKQEKGGARRKRRSKKSELPKKSVSSRGADADPNMWVDHGPPQGTAPGTPIREGQKYQDLRDGTIYVCKGGSWEVESGPVEANIHEVQDELVKTEHLQAPPEPEKLLSPDEFEALIQDMED